jgi:hypothetical protein
MNNKKTYNAILFFPPERGIRPRKYRNISKLDNFLKFARNSGGWYVNLYNAIDRKFEAREYVTGASS